MGTAQFDDSSKTELRILENSKPTTCSNKITERQAEGIVTTDPAVASQFCETSLSSDSIIFDGERCGETPFEQQRQLSRSEVSKN